MRKQFLTTASAIALAAYGWGVERANAGEPPVWIEIGWHGDQIYSSDNQFKLPIGSALSPDGITGPLIQNVSLSNGNGDDGTISFRPNGVDWTFSAAITYGRSRGKGAIRQAEPNPSFNVYHSSIPSYAVPWHETIAGHGPASNFIDIDTFNSESHIILDFQAGHDVGLGSLGTSTLSAGVRFANFRSRLRVANLEANTDFHLSHFQSTHLTSALLSSTIQYIPWIHSHNTATWREMKGTGRSSQNFSGIGPSIQWKASSPLFGNSEHGGQFSLDWGVNAALLFGRQKTHVQHSTKVGSYRSGFRIHQTSTYTSAGTSKKIRNITVPDVGGTAGISYRMRNLKVSVGYRADFFLRVLDTGIAGQSSSTRGFYGPFASISIGVGD